MSSKYHTLSASSSPSYDPYDSKPVAEEKKDFSPKYSQWSSSDGRIFIPSSNTVPLLTPGVYEIGRSPNIGLFFEKIPVKTEGLINFPHANSDKVVVEINKFWNREMDFLEYGIAYKRGVLLFGPPGSGKSSTIQLVMRDVISRGGIVLKFDEPFTFIEGMRSLRQIQPDCPVVVIMEDIDSILEDHSETEVLNILDGVNDVSKVVFLATTNYPDKLGARVVNRPSRFDKRFRIGYPSDVSRRMYLEHLIGKGDSEILASKIAQYSIDLDLWVKDTDKMSIAHIKELFVAVIILGDTYEEAIHTLKNMTETLEDKDYDVALGFSAVPSKDFYD